MTLGQYDLQAPRVFGIINRERLMARMALAHQHKLTLICAPPGCGKTTLAAQFAHQAPQRVVWHTLDERERDLPTLFRQCIAALGQVLPDIDALAAQTSWDAAELAGVLANYLRAELKEDIFFILDDVQHVIGATPCENWLRTFTSMLPQKCHLILLSRTLPPLPIAALVARGEVLAIGQEDLKFTPFEVEQLAQAVKGSPNLAPQVQVVIERLEGWAAGIVLALQPLPAEIERLFLGDQAGPEGLFDALATMMLDAQPPAQRDFLLASSTLTRRFTPELMRVIFGTRDAARWITVTLDKGLFLSRAAGGVMYHNLFRSFLQRVFRERYPERYADYHLKAATWYSERELVDEAFHHYICAGAPDQASAIVERMLPTYYAQGKVETLLGWHQTLSEAGISNPSLVYHAALIHSERLEHDEAIRTLDLAEAMCVERGDSVQLTEIKLQRARIHLVQGHYLAAIAQAEPLLPALADNDKLRSRGLRVVGFAYFRLGKTDLALRYLEEAVPLSRAYGDQLALSNLLQDLQIVYIRVGRFEDAAACLQEVVAIRRALGGGSFLAYALNDLGFHYHQHGDYAQALAALQEGFSVIAPSQNRRIESYLLWSMGDLQRDLGSFHEAWQLYSRALEFTANQEPSLRCNLLISASILRRWQRNYDEAISLAEEAHTLAQAHSLSIEERIAAACYWVTRGHQGEVEHALMQLLDLSAEFKSQSAFSEAAHVLALYAQVALVSHDKTAAVAQMIAASQLLKQGGSLQPMLAEIIHSGDLDKLILANSSKFSALLPRLTHLRNSQFGKPMVIDLQEKNGAESTYSLRVYTLGREKIERDGVPVLPSDWQAVGARELFFSLLFRGAQSREAISLEFWPNSSPAHVRSNFHTTLYRVRLALGENIVTYNNDLYSINPDIDIWCDVHEFQKLIKRAQSLSVRDARTEDLYRRAVDLYQGDFLSLLNREWITFTREDLSESYLEALNGLGRCAQARRDYRQALRLYKQALKLDPFREDVHRSIMSCYAEQGERQKVYAHFRQMQSLFQEELALEPTRETVQYAKTLLS